MKTAIVEATVYKSGERIALGIMNIDQALALPYDDLEFSNPCRKKSAEADEMPPFLLRDEFARLFNRT
ncbi:hypothetical protein ACRQ1B_05480 [Rhizobium panacihumi]|uniref:hypothetical protein n=1 Tax=Rhizobium panacihumi TaxID=2008450 RepID=UPI003D79D3DB